MKKAFTVIELIFVIVVLGILSTIAIPKFTGMKIEGEISKGRADIASIRSAIITERQSRLITGSSSFIGRGSGSNELDDGALFGGVLTYGITAKNSSGHWHTRANVDANKSTVKYKVGGTDVVFTYNSGDGTFSCTKSDTYCSELTD
ncbi:MAG: prepilin-type N-terminal cleavage/methylation domain-containing protein [Campylobacterota bacterium]|nr:prepilin-type N-terminal cleavage/methylation domain-containing protein [Campylobacterota bacterium]